MLLLCVIGLLIGSVFVLRTKKTWESLLLAAMCLALTVYFAGLLIFIAKKGGYSGEILRFLFLSDRIRVWVQYRYITLGQLGYLIAIGRYLFPLFLLELAGQYSMIPLLRRSRWLHKAAALLPGLSLVIYWPSVYRSLTASIPWVQDLLVRFSYGWILVYVFLALGLLAYEFLSITMAYCRRQFSQTFLCMAAMSCLYLLYCGQDPGQVYRFYSYDYTWIKGVGYLQYGLGLGGFVILVVASVFCGVLGLGGLLRYTQGHFLSGREDVVLERSFDVARTGASVFVHSIKNQLLANRVLYKRIRTELQKETPDLERLRSCADNLSEINEQLISRSENLYRTVKAKSVQLVPVELSRLAEITMDRFRKKYPDALINLHIHQSVQVLADENYLSEALYNLLTNAWEANMGEGHEDQDVELLTHLERLYTVFEVRDHGPGIPKEASRQIFEPFYSSKNSNFNWGMGLYHVRTIVKSHLGQLRVENRPEGGAAFFVLLPSYGGQTGKGGVRS